MGNADKTESWTYSWTWTIRVCLFCLLLSISLEFEFHLWNSDDELCTAHLHCDGVMCTIIIVHECRNNCSTGKCVWLPCHCYTHICCAGVLEFGLFVQCSVTLTCPSFPYMYEMIIWPLIVGIWKRINIKQDLISIINIIDWYELYTISYNYFVT